MNKNCYKIKTVEIFYNGHEDKFDAFLKSVIRDYINEDKISPDIDEKYNKKSA